jgi:hypothetical protein
MSRATRRLRSFAATLAVLPSMALIPQLHCLSLAPARLDRCPRGFTGHVAVPNGSVRDRDVFYVGFPIYA